jgi:hypothetical protein
LSSLSCHHYCFIVSVTSISAIYIYRPAITRFTHAPPRPLLSLFLSCPRPRHRAPAPLVSSAPALPRPPGGGDLPVVPPSAGVRYIFLEFVYVGRAGLPLRPPPRPCRLAVARRVLPPLTPRSTCGADRPPRAAWRRAGARPLRGGPGRQGARIRSTRAPRRAQ